LGFQFISVHQNSSQFISTAEATAEVNPLRAVQGVKSMLTQKVHWPLLTIVIQPVVMVYLMMYSAGLSPKDRMNPFT